MVQEPLAQTYARLVADIKDRIRSAQYDALKAVNKELIALYWDIGRLIVERQKTDSWGKAVVERLAADLRAEFPGVGGFSSQNLWYMRQFYLEYHNKPKLQPLVGEICWAKLAVKDEYTFDFLLHPETTSTRIERPVAIAGSHQRIAGGCDVKGHPNYGVAHNMVEIFIV